MKAAIAMSAYKSTTLIGEDTDLLVLLLYHVPANDCKRLYFRSDKGTPNVYNITVLKRLLCDDVCSDMLFIHAFSGCDTTSRIFGVGKKSVVQKVIAGDYVLHECSKVFVHRRLIPLLWKQQVVRLWCPCLMEANLTH